MPQIHDREVSLTYDLPPIVKSIRDGWQLTCQSAALVSGLLAGVAAQLYSFFKDKGNYTTGHDSPRARELILIFCYFSMFFNIGATISSFILIDGLGALQYNASALTLQETLPAGGDVEGTTNSLLLRYGVGSWWTFLAWQWLISFFCGILSLLILLLAYIFLQESLLIKVLMTLLTAFMVFPLVIFIFAPPPPLRRSQVSVSPTSKLSASSGSSYSGP